MIRYFLGVIWQLITTNPIKITTLVIAITSWNYAGSFQNGTYKEPVVSEVKDGSTWIYLTRNSVGRLIGKSDIQINPRRVSDHFITYSLSDLRKCPRFSTKTQNRNNLLDKLGI